MGESTYTIKKLISLALDGLLALSIAPLYFISVVGGVIITLSALDLVVSLACGVYIGATLQSQLVIVSCIALFSGVQIFCTGVVAAYMAKVLDETRARPTYIVGNRLGQGFEPGNRSNVNAVSGRQLEKAELAAGHR